MRSLINREKLVEILAQKPLAAQVYQMLEFILTLDNETYNNGFDDGYREGFLHGQTDG